MEWIKASIFGHEVSIAFDANSIHIYNAYPVKDNLKTRGYRWNPADKSWFLETYDPNQELVSLQGHDQNLMPSGSPRAEQKDTRIDGFPESYSVLELRNYLEKIISSNISHKIWIRGIVASEVKSYQWASYFDLKDEDDKTDLFFRVELRNNHKLLLESKLSKSGAGDRIEKDLPLFCQVELSISSRYSVDIKLKITDLLPEYTKEKIRNQREVTIETLKELGLIEKQKKLRLPALISKIGLISSELGTSCRDILAGLQPYTDKYAIYFVDARMEGANAAKSVMAALDLLESRAGELSLDAILIARGGGSEQSLSVFNDLELNQRVCKASLPILTAIGHEKDLTAIEICSHFTPSPSTPSGLGKFLQTRYLSLRDELNSKLRDLIKHFTRFHSRQTETIRLSLVNLNNHINFQIKFLRQHLRERINRLERSVILKVKIQENQITHFFARNREKFRQTIKNHARKSLELVHGILSRIPVQQRHKAADTVRVCRKLDLNKLLLGTMKKQQELKKMVQSIISSNTRKLQNSHKELHACIELVNASNPQRILKKGFTLTMDEQEAVIKTLEEFKKSAYKKLKFFDGTVEIIEKGEI